MDQSSREKAHQDYIRVANMLSKARKNPTAPGYDGTPAPCKSCPKWIPPSYYKPSTKPTE